MLYNSCPPLRAGTRCGCGCATPSCRHQRALRALASVTCLAGIAGIGGSARRREPAGEAEAASGTAARRANERAKPRAFKLCFFPPREDPIPPPLTPIPPLLHRSEKIGDDCRGLEEGLNSFGVQKCSRTVPLRLLPGRCRGRCPPELRGQHSPPRPGITALPRRRTRSANSWRIG